MARTRSLDAALLSLIASALRSEIRGSLRPLARAVRKLEAQIGRLRVGKKGSAGKGKRRGGRIAKYGECQIQGCDAKPIARGFCPKHYYRFKKHGSLNALSALVESRGKKIPEPPSPPRKRRGGRKAGSKIARPAARRGNRSGRRPGRPRRRRG